MNSLIFSFKYKWNHVYQSFNKLKHEMMENVKWNIQKLWALFFLFPAKSDEHSLI